LPAAPPSRKNAGVIEAAVGLATENLITPAFFFVAVPSYETSKAIVIKLLESYIKLVIFALPLRPVPSLKAP